MSQQQQQSNSETPWKTINSACFERLHQPISSNARGSLQPPQMPSVMQHFYEDLQNVAAGSSKQPVHFPLLEDTTEVEQQLVGFEKMMKAELESDVQQVLTGQKVEETPKLAEENQTTPDIQALESDQATASTVLSPPQFYDPDADELDAAWNSRFTRRYEALCGAPLPPSDAVLNCPSCMTQLCTDCQRHEVYQEQYRAMFVQNCRIDFSQCLECPTVDSKKAQAKEKFKERSRARKRHAQEANAASSSPDMKEPTGVTHGPKTSRGDLFHPVKCAHCGTTVAVYGPHEEIYHFFSVLASH